MENFIDLGGTKCLNQIKQEFCFKDIKHEEVSFELIKEETDELESDIVTLDSRINNEGITVKKSPLYFVDEQLISTEYCWDSTLDERDPLAISPKHETVDDPLKFSPKHEAVDDPLKFSPKHEAIEEVENSMVIDETIDISSDGDDTIDTNSSHINNGTTEGYIKQDTSEDTADLNKGSSLKESLLTCFICDYSTSIRSDYNFHYKIHRNGNVFKCKQCDFNTKRIHALKRHMKLHNDKIYKCKKCKFSSSIVGDYKLHLKIHVGENSKIECTKCKYKCVKLDSLNTHHMRNHSLYKPFKCDKCDYSSASNPTLQRHIRRIHTFETPYKCKLCDYAGNTSEKLKIHMFEHTGIKPYGCSECEATFCNRKQLKKHKMLHSDIKPYKCTKCDMSFGSQSFLTFHDIKLHSGISLVCKVCNKSFLTLPQMRIHLRKKHDNIVPKHDNMVRGIIGELG